jgi:Rrf2 family protein
MQITRRADYGVRTMLDVASLEFGAVAFTHEVAARQGIPLPFLAKIVPALTRAGLLRSYRGAGGGIALSRPADRITLLEVVEAVDGPVALNLCVIWPEECGRSGTCPVHRVWCEARAVLAAQLSSTTIASLLERNAVSPGGDLVDATPTDGTGDHV